MTLPFVLVLVVFVVSLVMYILDTSYFVSYRSGRFDLDGVSELFHLGGGGNGLRIPRGLHHHAPVSPEQCHR